MARDKMLDKKYIPITVGVVLVAWTVFAIVNFMTNLFKIETAVSDENLSSIAHSNVAEVNVAFDRYISALNITAIAAEEVVTLPEDFRSTKVLSLLSSIALSEGYEQLCVVYPDGSVYRLEEATSDGVSSRDSCYTEPARVLDRIKSGETFIDDVSSLPTNGSQVVDIFVPLRSKTGAPVAALRCSIKTKTLSKVFDQTFVKSQGYYHVVDGNGRYVATSETTTTMLMNESFLVAINDLTYDKGYSADQILSSFKNGADGFVKYSYEDEHRYAYYTPVGINDWVIMMIVPKEIIDKNTVDHSKNALTLTAQIIFILLIIMMYIYHSQRGAKNKALLNEQCFKALSEQTGKVIFEWDFEKNKITSMTNFKMLFGRDAATRNSASDALDAGAVHPDDKEAFSRMFDLITNGESVSAIQFRVADVDGVYHWCEISGLVVKDYKGRPYRAIASLENIDEQIKKEEELKRKAERDQLTGLYNKTTTELLIKAIMIDRKNSGGCHALMIIDIDNFKGVNDQLGHLYGDIVLARLAEILKPIFRADDIIGRIGGDEFFVFLKNYTSLEIVRRKAKEVRRQFRITYSENGVSVSISASIGISIFPSHGKDFEELYKSADIALYNTKAGGKDNFTIFDGKTVNQYQSSRSKIEAQGDLPQKSFNDNRLEYIFKLLYSSENPISSVKSALKLIAGHGRFHRGYIVIGNEGLTSFSQTFEWCADGISSVMDYFQNIPRNKIDFVLRSFSEDGTFICQDTSKLLDKMGGIIDITGVKSLYQFAIISDNKVIGYIGFDDCERARELTNVEIDELATICKVLSTFILKQRALEAAHNSYQAIVEIMDNFDGSSYVVDPDSFELLYENKNVLRHVNSPMVGQKCYKAYANLDAPCPDCPLVSLLSQGGDKVTKETFNPIYDIHTNTTASLIDWTNGKKAGLISSFDISEYRK